MESKVSVIIPNYNGEELLSHNLPLVVKNCKGCEVIVIDDASKDNSVQFIKKNYSGIILVENSKNIGFARSVNKGVKKASGEYVLLLNSDVSPREDFLEQSLKLFSDNNLFAVALADYSHERSGVVIRGRGGAQYKKGFVSHYKLSSKNGETLWVSGGSGIFNKEKFLELGGFDPVYAPYYWEDIDLSFRAWRRGWKCIFEPKSRVDHFHEKGAIKKSASKFFIKTVSYKNQFIFVWKNVDDYFLIIQHLLWQPYHLTRAILTFDLSFIFGFFWAIVKIPALIIEHLPSESSHYNLSAREVLEKFEKQ